jgi:hypothetical protein
MKQHMHDLTDRPHGHDAVLVATLSSHANMVKVPAMARGTVRPRPSLEQDMNPGQSINQLPGEHLYINGDRLLKPQPICPAAAHHAYISSKLDEQHAML